MYLLLVMYGLQNKRCGPRSYFGNNAESDNMPEMPQVIDHIDPHAVMNSQIFDKVLMINKSKYNNKYFDYLSQICKETFFNDEI